MGEGRGGIGGKPGEIKLHEIDAIHPRLRRIPARISVSQR